MKRIALGKGLEALIPGAISKEDDTSEGASTKKIFDIPVEKIKPNPFQPRQVFDAGRLAELVESIKEGGLIQPLVVRKSGDDYQLIVGERRLRAMEKLGWETAPAVIIESPSNETVMEMALIENIQREDLNPIEEASAYYKLITECNISQADVATRVGKDRSSVANSIRLLSLPDRVKNLIIEGRLSAGHARALLAIDNDAEKISLAEKFAADGLSVRELEKLVYTEKSRQKSKKAVSRPPQLESIEESLKRKFATRVSINQKRKGGKIIIEYYSDDELNRLLEIFGVLENY
ncbi:MAG: ParB/RepB/Spo0J family partition protein [Candidatus Zixiibacteriota bacterium]|nr:MAG: ParB/RepB/Spo0J family partition protein [candidate division Zixibacteria bacterium]